MRRNRLRSKAAATLAIVASILAVAAPASGSGFGPRVGLTSDPDQLHAGLHAVLARPSRHVAFVPNFELGISNNLLVFSGNFDFQYTFTPRNTSVRPYFGGGPALHHVDVDGGGNNTEVGLGIVGGVRTPTRSGAFFGEIRFGVVDSPDVKFTVGWMFY